MSKDYDLFSASDMRRLKRELVKDAQAAVEEDAMSESYEINCPHCNEEISIKPGRTLCPKCGGEIELNLDIDLN